MKWFTPLVLFYAVAIAAAVAGLVAACSYGHPKETFGVPIVHATDFDPQRTKCSFEKPLKHLTLIMHWYSDREELNADFITLAAPNDFDQVWGWSNCVWQEEDDAAFCDVYAMQPTFVYSDMDIDTIGHEVFHAACRDFHE